MSFFNKIFKSRERERSDQVSQYMEMLNSYTPIFSTRSGGVYETELTRSAIHAKAKHTAKLKPQIIGSASKELELVLQNRPNSFQSTYEFLYRLRTIYEVDTYVFILPLYNQDYSKIVGFYPLKANQVELMDYMGKIWLRYTFLNGKRAAIEYEKVGVISKYSYHNEFLGDGNNVLNPTMSLLHLQNQGIQEGIKQGAMIRFMAKIGRVINPDDLEKERKSFTDTNLNSDNNSGVLIFDQKYEDIKQIDSKPFIVDDKQMSFIKSNVYSYFGVNEDILQNKFDEDGWNAFYEGEIETFSLQLSLAITNMLFSDREKAFTNQVLFTSNRLQYASNKTKLEVSQTLFDRGIFGVDDIAEIWNMPLTGDNKKYIRKEYAEVGQLTEPLEETQKNDSNNSDEE